MTRALQTAALAAALTLALPLAVQAQDESFFSFVSDPGDYIGAGESRSFTPDTSSFNSSQNLNGSEFSSMLFPFAGGFWMVHFAAPSGQPLTPGVYENATRWPFQQFGVPGLDVSGDGRGCNMLNGRFEVLEAVFGPAGYVERFHATFEQHCEGADPALRGEILIVNPPPPPVLTISLALAVKDTVDRAGTATVAGTVTCSAPTIVNLFGDLRQQVTRFALASGQLSVQVPCSTTPTAWSARVTPIGNVPFGPGYGALTLRGNAYDANYGSIVTQDVSGAVRLTRSNR